MRVKRFLHHTGLNICGASDSGALFSGKTLVPKPRGAVPKKHAAAVECPHAIFPRVRRNDVLSAMMVFSRKE